MMIAIDIETLGKLEEVPLPAITCICMYNGQTGEKYSLRFYQLSPEEIDANLKVVIEVLDKARFIAGYNVVLFDLEFIKKTFNISESRMTSWVRKCIDPFMYSKYLLKSTCKLNNMLAENDLASKTGSGSDAITLALEGKWEELLDYCMMDTTLTYDLCTLNWTSFSPVLKGKWDFESSNWIFQFRDLNNQKHNYLHKLPQISMSPIAYDDISTV
jgi:hypothetical protein